MSVIKAAIPLVSGCVLAASLHLSTPRPARAQSLREPDRKAAAQRLIRQAEAKIKDGNFPGALEDASGAMAFYPEDDALARNVRARALDVKADAFMGLKRTLEAESAALDAIRQEPDNSASYEILASAQLHRGDYSIAEENASRAIRLGAGKRNTALSYYVRACAREQMGKKASMLEDIERAGRLNPLFEPYLDAAKKGARLFNPAAEPRMRAPSPRNFPYGAWLGLAAFGAFCLLGLALLRGEAPSSSRLFPAPRKGGDLLADKYELARIIGRGGMGEVWEAMDQSLGRSVAVKRMSSALEAFGPKAKELYLKEARILASVHHPHIVDIYEILDLPGGMYLVFELIAGRTLQQILLGRKRLPLAYAKKILEPVCEALDWAHGRGIVHRDLKPANIMVSDEDYVKVMDFGIARALGDSSPGQAFTAQEARPLRTKTIGGTPPYMAPEAWNGIVSPAADVYSLGVCLYEMLTDELPFGTGDSDKPRRDYVKASARAPDLSPGTDALIEAALKPDKKDRISSVREFWTRMRELD